MSPIKEEQLERVLKRIKRSWPACEKIREQNGVIELAIKNSMGGDHWISPEGAPNEIENILREEFVDFKIRRINTREYKGKPISAFMSKSKLK